MVNIRSTVTLGLCFLLVVGCSCPTKSAGGEMRGMMAPAPAQPVQPATVARLQSIHFATDSAAIPEEAKATLNDNVRWLNQNGNPKVELAGHTDERGSAGYNKALGLKRAQAAKDYLVSLGQNPNEFSTLSYGEQMPADPGHNEAAWSKNRRIDFNVKQ